MNIEERIKEVDLRPSDIVKLQVPPSQPVGKKPRTPIDLSQATGWLKDPTATKAIEQLLWRLCDEKVDSGLTFSKPGRKKESVVAEIFSEIKPISLSEKANDELAAMRSVVEGCKQVMGEKLLVPESELISKKIPAKTHISLSPTGFPSWGADKTYKFVGTMLKVNFDGKGYNALGVAKIGDSFIIEGTHYPVSEFTKVG